MTAGVIDQHQIAAGGIGSGKIIDKPLHHGDIERGKLHKMAGSTRGFDGTKDPGVLKPVLMDADGLHAPTRQSPSANGMEAEATLIAGPDPDRQAIGRRDRLSELVSKRGLKSSYGISVFLGYWGRGTLRLALSL